MSKIEYQWMSKRFRFSVERSVIFYDCKQFFVKLKSLIKIFEKLSFQLRNLNSAFNCF